MKNINYQMMARHRVNPGDKGGKWRQIVLPLRGTVRMLGLSRRPHHEAKTFRCKGMPDKPRQGSPWGGNIYQG